MQSRTLVHASLIVLAFAILPAATSAGTATAPFEVRVNVVASPAASSGLTPLGRGFCSSNAGAFGATVTVVCRTGYVVAVEATGLTSTHGGAYRYRLPGSEAQGEPRTIDAEVAPGTITQWRVVKSG